MGKDEELRSYLEQASNEPILSQEEEVELAAESEKGTRGFETALSEQICAWLFPLSEDMREKGCHFLRSLERAIGD